MSNNKLRHDWINLCLHNRDGSHATQYARRAALKMAARQLERDLGFRNMRASSLGQRHLVALVKHWQAEGLGVGTIKNRMAHLRWAAEKVGKPGVAAISNAALGLEKRVYVAKVSRAIDLPTRTLELITDPHVHISLRLQEAFGLRREESLKIIPSRAWQGDRLVLQASWTKGGRPREIPVRTDQQRSVLLEAARLAGRGSLIPPQRSYIEHLRIYERQLSAAGISRAHGLRHAYAQQRYEELTGRLAPVALGEQIDGLRHHAVSKLIALPGRITDTEARRIVSAELGHARTQITTVYLGR
ncbi:integrase [Pseudomonas sp. CrR25]|nr:integrase [Pseudomonas sp. CrR25]